MVTVKLHEKQTLGARLSRLMKAIWADKWLYVLLLPGFLYFVVFKYVPMYGVVISFKNYTPFVGIGGSPWVGMYWYNWFFVKNHSFWHLFYNTIWISLLNLTLAFPAPILLALLLNELRSDLYKKIVQTFLYVPHFISIVIVCSITYVAFNSSGIVTLICSKIFGSAPEFLTSPGAFRPMIIGQTIWKETGWGTIIFLAALAGVDMQLYEAAMVDGAGRLRQLWHITLPCIRSTVVLMLVLRMGSVLNTGYEHLILMSNSLNRTVAETFDVFVYNQGLQGGQYSYSTAVGLFKSLVSLILVMSSNKLAHAMGESGLY